MKFIKSNIKKYLVRIIFIIIISIVLMRAWDRFKILSLYCRGIINGGNPISFVFPFVDKNIENDTLFTIAIGNNILKNGFTNLDTLTWHENLAFPHSRNF